MRLTTLPSYECSCVFHCLVGLSSSGKQCTAGVGSPTRHKNKAPAAPAQQLQAEGGSELGMNALSFYIGFTFVVYDRLRSLVYE